MAENERQVADPVRRYEAVLESLAWLIDRLGPSASNEVMEHLEGVQCYVREWHRQRLIDGQAGG